MRHRRNTGCLPLSLGYSPELSAAPHDRSQKRRTPRELMQSPLPTTFKAWHRGIVISTDTIPRDYLLQCQHQYLHIQPK